MPSGVLAKLVRSLFYVSAALWVGLSLWSVARIEPWVGAQAVVRMVIAVLMLGNAALLAWFGWMVSRQPPRFLRLALLYVFLNLVLSITDEFGWFDFFSLVYNLVLLALCVRLYFSTNRRTP